jgi:polyribonucleotide nucleotidyltransferase
MLMQLRTLRQTPPHPHSYSLSPSIALFTCRAVRVARVAGELVVNPTKSQLAGSDLDLDMLLAARGPDRVVMLEMGGRQVGGVTEFIVHVAPENTCG